MTRNEALDSLTALLADLVILWLTDAPQEQFDHALGNLHAAEAAFDKMEGKWDAR